MDDVNDRIISITTTDGTVTRPAGLFNAIPGMAEGLDRMLSQYERIMYEEMRWSAIQMYRFEHGQMPPERWSFGWYTDLEPWRTLRPIRRRIAARQRLIANRVRQTLYVARHGYSDSDW